MARTLCRVAYDASSRAIPEGDSLQDLVARTANALRFVLERHTSKTETVVFVGHDSVNRALLLQLLDQSLSAYWRIAQRRALSTK